MTVRNAPTPAEVALRIRVQMQRHDLQVGRAAEDCGLSRASFETYLYGKSLPGAAALLGLSKGLRCSADWLLAGDRQ